MLIIILDYTTGTINFEFLPEKLHLTSGFSTWFDPETYLNDLGYDISNINWMLTIVFVFSDLSGNGRNQ